MNGVEAAASLFGSDDPASDPFAALGKTTTQPSVDGLVFNIDGASSNPDFLNASEGDSLFTPPEGVVEDTSQFYTQSQSASSHSTASTYTHLGAGSTSQQGWHDTQGQLQHYEQQGGLNYEQQSLNSSATDGYKTLHTSSNLQDAYAPPSIPYAPMANTPASTQPPYNNYTPSQLASNYVPSPPPTSVYAPPINTSTSTQTPYNNYTPAQPASTYVHSHPPTSTYAPYAYSSSAALQGSSSQYTSPYTNGGQTPYTTPTEHPAPLKTASSVLVPPPVPAPATTVTRPKISNAYDPPFPTAVNTNRRAGRTGSGQNVYGYNVISPPVPTYGVHSQNSSYTSLVPPSHGISPQRQPLPQPPPQAPLAPLYSHLPPQPLSTPPPRSPVQLPYKPNSHTSQPNLGGVGSMASSPPPVDGSYSRYNSERELQDDSPSDADSHPSLAAVEAVSTTTISQPVGPAMSYSNLATETSVGYEPARPEFHQKQSHLPLSSLVRPDSPHQYALPPSPTLSQQRGHSSPFMETNISTTERNVSPQPPIESSDTGPYALSRDSTRTPSVRSPPQFSSPLRSTPPPATLGNGQRGPHTGATNYYQPKANERVASPTHSLNGHAGTVSDPYAPKIQTNGHKGERTASPSPSLVGRLAAGGLPSSKNYTPYAPPRTDLRSRSVSNSSLLSTTSTSPEDPYAPSQQNGSFSSRYNYSNGQEAAYHPPHAPEHPVQEITLKTFQTPYAPSPSLLGANDPLGRTSAQVPIFSFGFGGKLVTCFHGADSLSTGFDVALSSRNSTGVTIRVLKTLIPESALDTSAVSFPGPLFGDTNSLTTSLVRAGVTAHAKTKKAKVSKYLAERADELALGLRYIKPNSSESRGAEGKLILVKLLQLMVDHDGRLSGTPELDTAVRSALVPRLEGTFETNGTSSSAFVAVADARGSILPGYASESHEIPISITTLRPSALDKIQDFLLRGERRQAYHYALDERLWTHAMIIASSIDKEAWKEVVNEFLRTELGPPPTHSNSDLASPPGRESLRVAYSLFSGQGAAAVQELIPQNLLARATTHVQSQVIPSLTPRTPNFNNIPVANLSPDTLSKWPETAAMILSSPLSQESSAALTALGDRLVASQVFEAAHVCYLLAPQTSPLGGIGQQSARIVLVGSRNPQAWPSVGKDQDPLIFSEIVEFALSLASPAKGQEVFSGITHLQAYRFIRAMAMAEIGDIQQANRYCDAISAAAVRGSPYTTSALLEQLKGLSDRIAGVTQVDKSFWTGGKLSKPSLDTIGGWLEGRFTKLVTGDADMDKMPEEDIRKPEDGGFSGPFSHYSTISSNTPSARSSPQPSLVNFNAIPPRAGSAMANTSPYANPQIDRASSAMDYRSNVPPPAPRIASANASTTSFGYTPSFGQALGGQQSHSNYNQNNDLITPRPSLNSDDESTVQEVSWWSGNGYSDGPATETPTAATFMRVDESAIPASISSDGFISLMDNASYTVGPANPVSQVSSHPMEEYEEDLGFGNSDNKKQNLSNENDGTKASAGTEPPKPVASPPSQENKPTPPAGGWLSRWWKKSDVPGPIKASLGEQSTFYYDKEQKRWVNKSGGTEAAKAPLPPPPSRAQTASPAMTGPRVPGPVESGPPPNRPASAIDLSTSPPSRTTMRVRSNLVPAAESAPSTPTGTRIAPPGPPPGRPQSQASKRSIRSRYVDVFQQESTT